MKVNRLICVLVASLQLSGCTTLNTLPYPQGRFEDGLVRPGDRVVLTAIHGEDRRREERRFEVTSVTPEQICGRAECIPADAVESIQREEFSIGRTVGLVLAIALMAAIAKGAGSPLRGGLGGGNQCWFCP